MSETPLTTAESDWGNRTGIAAAAKYNPHLWSAEELRAIFVARQNELASILQSLRTASVKTAPQHLLITGQRGMGKSTLLQRVALAVEEDTTLRQTWMPLRFPEEQYTVSSPAELWANVIGALADAVERRGIPTVEIDKELARLAHLPAAQREDASLAWLHQWCIDNNRRLLLLMDSTDLLFANLAGGDASKRNPQQDGGASALWRVRKALSHSPDLFWLGGSYQPLEVQGLYSDAFLDFFQLIELRPLTLLEMQAAIQAMARMFGAGRGLRGDYAEAEVKRMLDERPERLRAMRQLTGGNPRTTVMLYELFAAGGRDNVRADLERLLDAMTPLYKARLEILADQPRKVLAHVMEHWAPITAKALAQAAALSVSSVSAQLTRLEQEGLIEKTTLSGTKRRGFQTSERFFNIWYLMRNAPRGARARVGWLVEFMRLWYSTNELQDLARTRWNEHRDGIHCDSQELEYSRAIARAMPEEAEDRQQLDWAVFQQARKGPMFGELYELKGNDADFSTPHNYMERAENLRKALKLTPLPKEEENAWISEVTSAFHLTLAEKEALANESKSFSTSKLAEIRLALSEKRDKLIAVHGRPSVEQVERAVASDQFFPDCPESKLAHTQMVDCFEKFPDAFVVALGRLLSRRSDEHVEKTCIKATGLAPKNARPWDHLGDLLSGDPTRYADAERAYRKAIDLDPKWAIPWGGLGDLMRNQSNRSEESEAAYRKAIALNPKWPTPWSGLGDLLRNQPSRIEESESAYRKAIALSPKWARPWSRLGDLLSNEVRRHEEAESAYRTAIDLDPNWARPWDGLASLLSYKLKRYEEAEKAYRKAIEVNPKWARPWGRLGDLLRNERGRNEEAESAYRKAIKLDPKLAAPWNALGGLLSDRLGRYEEAESAYRKAIKLNPKMLAAWNGLGDLLQDRLKNDDEAEVAYRTAIECDERNPYPVVNLARLLARLRRDEEASELFRQSIKLAGGNNDNLLLQAHCWLGNSDLAMQALDALAERASKSIGFAFHQLKVQCFECDAIGLSARLVEMMERSRFSEFLQPFSLALRAAMGEGDAMLDVAVEIRGMAEEVLREIDAFRSTHSNVAKQR